MSLIKGIWDSIFGSPYEEEYAAILDQYSEYFRQLDAQNRQRFLRRLRRFILSVKFKAELGMKVDEQMKVIISSAFIQITFGLRSYTLKEYKKILLVPRPYTYPGIDAELGGHVSPRRRLVKLVWPTVVEGFLIEDDAVNIAIHEFGHCLSLENFSRLSISKFFRSEDWYTWRHLAFKKMKVIRAGENQVIRNYGGTNLMEFFSVSLETFFERPAYFKKILPELYYSMTKLLNQDPLRTSSPRLDHFA